MQHNKYVDNQGVKMYCATNQVPELKFLGLHKKTHGASWLGKHYPMPFDPKLGHGIYTISQIPCACTSCTYSLYQPWITGLSEQQELRYQPIKYCTYWPVLGSFNNWNILKSPRKSKSSE